LTLGAPARLPYPGLRSFRREESDLFFGREDCIGMMVDRLAATRFLAVLGSSGTGKSSIVKTGLLDALDLGFMAAAGSNWRVVDFRPGEAPIRHLARRLLETESDGLEAPRVPDQDEVELLRAFLARGPRSLAEWRREGRMAPSVNLLLLVDQFEEMFRYQDYAGREEAEAFTALLLESARVAHSRIYVVLTMRSEYLGACALVEGLAEAITEGIFLVPRMNRGQCREAIVGPARICGFEIEDALINRLLNDLAAFAPWDDRGGRGRLERLGRRADQLPLLQYCLNRMWVRAMDGAGSAPVLLTLADYERIGALGGALDAHADEILAALGADRAPVAERAFRALTEGATVADAVRRPASFGELVEICDGDEAALRAVVDAFRAPGCNFLSPEADVVNPKSLTAETIVDISHESLIRQWKLVSGWLEAEARDVRIWRRLKERFDDGEALQKRELANILAWLDEQRPNLAWARRYGGDFSAITRFIESSEQRRRRFAPVMMPLFGLATILISAVFVFGGWAILLGSSEVPAAPFLVWQSLVAAVTCAFGLWWYSGRTPRTAWLAGSASFLLGSATAVGLIVALSKGNQQDAEIWWNATLAPACFVTTLAIFEPTLRRLPIWLLLVVPYSLLIGIASLVPGEFVVRMLLYIIVWCIECCLFGVRLRRAANSREPSDPGPAWAAATLSLIFLATCVLITFWTSLVLKILTQSTDFQWQIGTAVGSASLAITFAFALRRWRGLGPKTAALAGPTVFILHYVLTFVCALALLSYGLPLLQAQHWAGALLGAPSALTGLAVFDRDFRKISVWLLFVVLFAAPFSVLAWLYDTARISINLPTFSFLVLVLVTIWIAAIGYRMRAARTIRKSDSIAASPMRALETA
jgi:hypothetical protein